MLFPIFLIACFGLACYLAIYRRIGIYWALFFCLTLTPLIGLFITIFSSKNRSVNPELSTYKKLSGKFLMIIASLGVLGQLPTLFSTKDPERDLSLEMELGLEYTGTRTEFDYFSLAPLILFIGLIGFGYFLNEVGKGVNFNYKLNFDKYKKQPE